MLPMSSFQTSVPLKKTECPPTSMLWTFQDIVVSPILGRPTRSTLELTFLLPGSGLPLSKSIAKNRIKHLVEERGEKHPLFGEAYWEIYRCERVSLVEFRSTDSVLVYWLPTMCFSVFSRACILHFVPLAGFHRVWMYWRGQVMKPELSYSNELGLLCLRCAALVHNKGSRGFLCAPIISQQTHPSGVSIFQPLGASFSHLGFYFQKCFYQILPLMCGDCHLLIGTLLWDMQMHCFQIWT